MGKNSVVQQIARAATDVTVAPIRETARAVGAKGVVDLANNFNREVTGALQQVGDLVSGDNKKQAAESAAASAQAEAEAAKKETEQVKAKENDAKAQVEKERMAAGSRARTLLTGPKGLTEETDANGKPITISRRTLKAR